MCGETPGICAAFSIPGVFSVVEGAAEQAGSLQGCAT